MKAVLWTAYGAAATSLAITHTARKPQPHQLSRTSVLIRVHAAGIAQGDCEMRALNLPAFIRAPIRLITGLVKPRTGSVLGQEFSGVVEHVGSAVDAFKIGDQVYGTTGVSFGAYAEFVAVDAGGAGGSLLAIKPSNLTHAQASVAALSAMEALCFLRQARMKEGDNVLVIGAGGNIGSFAVQLAKRYFKAGKVVGVDSTNKLDMMRELGADHVADFTKEDYVASTQDKFDVILDAPGKCAFKSCERIMNEGGRYAKAMFGFGELLGNMLPSTGTKEMVLGMATYQKEDFELLTRLFEEGIIAPVIDRSFKMDDVVKAHEYSESGQKVGCIAMTIP
ncbi:hypothetical protein BJ741DRAFT_602991 [Chytriomyces cf. hyalinus JEL632]|nr:hypothetical protein BJ741DRAFT_602991 [Chytriomyces cf. hyalinus JEL632]